MRNLIAVFFILCCTVCKAANSISAKTAELTRVATQIQQLQHTLTLDQQEQQNLENELEKTEVTIGELNQEMNSLNQSISHEQQRLTKLKNSQQITINQLNKQQAALTYQLRAAYQLGQAPSLKIILNNKDPNTLQRHLNYFHRLSETRLQLITNTKKTLDELDRIMQSIAHDHQHLKNLFLKKQTQQSQQQSAYHHRQQLLHTLHQSVQTKQQRLSTLITNQKNLQEIITRLNVETQSGVSGLSFKELHGKLHWPIKGMIVSNFGNLLDVGEQRLSGVLINAEQGTPVRAIYSGKIIFANWLRGFGLLIIINHGNNYMSLYGRNQALYAKVGTSVNTGDVIAAAGNTGGYNKASLYFEIRQNGTPVNPNIWCR